MDRQDRETRRAENQVWNGWGDYARKPELLTFDRAGDAELYGNTVLGLACETVESPTSVYEARLQAANYDIYLGITKLPTTADLSEFYRPWGEMSWGGLANETIYNMVNQSLADRGNYYNLHKLVADDGRIIPVMAGYYAIYAKRGVLSDLNPARDNVFYYTLGKTMESSKVATQFS